jgi:hypothetical protein
MPHRHRDVHTHTHKKREKKTEMLERMKISEIITI